MKAFVWVGGLALIFAGFFLVKYGMEHGLMSPPVRVVSAFGFSPPWERLRKPSGAKAEASA